MQRALKRTCAGMVATAAASTALIFLPMPTAEAVGTPAGPANLSPDAGTSSTSFTLQLPQGASCEKDSANGGYNVTSYMVPIEVDPASLQFDPLGGPLPAGLGDEFSQPLYEAGSGSAYLGIQTANADVPGGPGRIINIPQFNFGDVFGPGQVGAGSYNVGIACILGAPDADQLHEFWNTTITVTADPAGGPAEISWFEGVPAVEAPPVADFDGDGDSDRAVFRPSNGRWYVHGSVSGSQFGTAGDIPAPLDWDADGDVDRAVYRPSSGRWYVDGVAGSSQWGTEGDIPVPADYDGDGEQDRATYRPATGRWYVQGQPASVQWGAPTDIPVPADYDGDGDTDIAVFRPSNGKWYVHGVAGTVTLGTNGDVPVPADYDGDGAAERAVFRPTTGRWFVDGEAPAGVQFGAATDVLVPGDYDGDGDDDIAVFRPSNGVWYVLGQGSVTWGTSTDVPVSRRPLGTV